MSDTFGSGQSGNPSLVGGKRRRGRGVSPQVRRLPLRVGENVADYVLTSPGARLHCVEYRGRCIAVCTSEGLGDAQTEGRRIGANHQRELNGGA